MIIDCHCHAGPGDGLTGPWDTNAPLGQYEHWARAAGIDQTVLFPAFHTDYALANRRLADYISSDPGRYLGFAFVHAARDRGRIAGLIHEAVRVHGFAGIKVHRHDARITREVCDAARRHGIPILYDVAGEIMTAELLAVEYPDVAFIIPHLGSFADDWRAQKGLIPILERYPNIFADTSGVRRFDVLQEAVERAGARKILFGSDGPWLHPGVERAKIELLPISAADKAAILGGNFQRIHGGRWRRAIPAGWF